MKARLHIIGALLLAVGLSPAATWAFAGHATTASSSGHAAISVSRRPFDRARTRGNTHAARQLTASLPGSHKPAARMHRMRGKRISIERPFESGPGCCELAQNAGLILSADRQDLDGPNPSRGPPSTDTLQ